MRDYRPDAEGVSGGREASPAVRSLVLASFLWVSSGIQEMLVELGEHDGGRTESLSPRSSSPAIRTIPCFPVLRSNDGRMSSRIVKNKSGC